MSLLMTAFVEMYQVARDSAPTFRQGQNVVDLCPFDLESSAQVVFTHTFGALTHQGGNSPPLVGLGEAADRRISVPLDLGDAALGASERRCFPNY